MITLSGIFAVLVGYLVYDTWKQFANSQNEETRKRKALLTAVWFVCMAVVVVLLNWLSHLINKYLP